MILGIHLILNALWSYVFFELHFLLIAFGVLLLLITTLICFMHITYHIDRKITYLLIPYLIWISFASVLNMSLYLLN
ncbi:MAG: tryptophan-rich sensory protein [Alphaproteobacteria bacterium]|nr:tryptophan-rich sensory protein [Alphaproteobacteria bacterium]